jgi:regulator of sirC expression with transglutaminase-like and TPR domain
VIDNNQLKALVKLLDDPDEDIYGQIESRLLEMGAEVIPFLENAWEDSQDEIIQTRIENIIQKINYDDVCRKLVNWARLGGQNLLTGALLIAKYQFPEMDEEKVKNYLNQLRQDVWIELNDNLTAMEKVKTMNHILFNVHGFNGNRKNYHAPNNSYINCVLESKKGNPLSIGMIYMIIAQGLDIPVYGVNLPEHFVLAYEDELKQFATTSSDNEQEGILFYINPFSGGTIFGKKEIISYLEQIGMKSKRSYFVPCSNIDLILRNLNNLIFSYQKNGKEGKVDEIKHLLNLIESYKE